MRASLLRQATAAQGRTPLIQFVGKRPGPSQVNPEEHSPHPSSPPELVQAFQKLFSRYDPSTVKATEQRRHGAGSGSTAGSSAGSAKDSGSGFVEAAKEGGSTSSARPTGSVSYSEFWKAPQKLWKGVEMTEKEMETVMMGGAS